MGGGGSAAGKLRGMALSRARADPGAGIKKYVQDAERKMKIPREMGPRVGGDREHPILRHLPTSTSCLQLLNGSCSAARTGELREEKEHEGKCTSVLPPFPPSLIHSAGIRCMPGPVQGLRVPWGFVHGGCSGGICALARLPAV